MLQIEIFIKLASKSFDLINFFVFRLDKMPKFLSSEVAAMKVAAQFSMMAKQANDMLKKTFWSVKLEILGTKFIKI